MERVGAAVDLGNRGVTDGRVCHLRSWRPYRQRKPKRRYETLDEAWVGAFVNFAYAKAPFCVPYRCAVSTSPLHRRQPIACGAWHLTSTHRHILAP